MAELTAEQLHQKLSERLGTTHVEVIDVSGGCGSSFEVVIVSEAFEGKRTLERHRLVNNCLAEELNHIHAFSQKTYTPQQWANRT